MVLPDELYANAIDDLLSKLNKHKRTFTAKKIASLIGSAEWAISRARNPKNPSGKFGKLSRQQILDLIAEKTGKIFTYSYIEESNIIEVRLRKDTLVEHFDDVYVYNTYYWRDRPISVGVGIMKIVAQNGKWDYATLIVDNKYPSFRDDAPYYLTSSKIESLGKNTFIDLRDDNDETYRQTGIFRTGQVELKKRMVIEGIFASITRKENKPIAGIMIMELLDKNSKTSFVNAEKADLEIERSGRKNDLFENRQRIMSSITVPDQIYASLYRKRIQSFGEDIIELGALPASKTLNNLKNYIGVFEGHFIRSKESTVEIFLLEFYKNGTAKIYFPSSSKIEAIRSSPTGHFKWVNKPKRLLTANFDYQHDEDHWRFRFIIDGEYKSDFLYGVYAGTEFQSVEPVSGRLRLKKLMPGGKNRVSNATKSDSIDSYKSLLNQVAVNSSEYWNLMKEDQNLRDFFNGTINPNFTDCLNINPLFDRRNNANEEMSGKVGEGSLAFYGDCEIFSLYRQGTSDGHKYFVLKQPIRISKDGSVLLKIRGQNLISGKASISKNALKVNFDDKFSSYSHLLFTVNELQYEDLDRAFGILTGVHVKKNRSEAAAAILVGPHKHKTDPARMLNFESNDFREFEVGSEEFFQLDEQVPSKVASFLSGHYNRYISPPSEPNSKIQTRLSKYRLPPFKAACYSAVKYSQSKSLVEGGKPLREYEFAPDQCKQDCLDSIEEAFQHGFCDPKIVRQNIVENVHPKLDVDIFLAELLPGGLLGELVDPILDLCDLWGRDFIRQRYDQGRSS